MAAFTMALKLPLRASKILIDERNEAMENTFVIIKFHTFTECYLNKQKKKKNIMHEVSPRALPKNTPMMTPTVIAAL